MRDVFVARREPFVARRVVAAAAALEREFDVVEPVCGATTGGGGGG